jgi:glyoxylase-like metal-dependent hydrolase (beta-lactamase superfamily II)
MFPLRAAMSYTFCMIESVAPGTVIIDVEFLGFPEAIGAVLLRGANELAIIDCGPTSCLPTLRRKLAERGIAPKDLTALLLTHIHLDHAGASGSLVRENPKLRVYVHEKGAPHMAAPEKLLKSAGRLYGSAMQEMYGDFLAVPAENLVPLTGGEKLRIADREIEVAYTPGHASHHASYFDQSTGVAFIGDTTGLRRPGFDYIAPVTPPPDIDLAAWRTSLDEIVRRKPSRLCLTHFGPFDDVSEHLERTWAGLEYWTQSAGKILQAEPTDELRLAAFLKMAEEDFLHHMTPADAHWYSGVSSPTLSWLGLSRYWTKKHAAPTTAPHSSL